MLIFVILGLIFFSTVLISNALLPWFVQRYHQMQEKKATQATQKLDNLFVEIEKKKLSFIFIFTPLVLGVAALLLYRNPWFGLGGGFIGIVLPNSFISLWEKKRKMKFQVQLLDGLMLISNCLKAGLSLFQALEVLVEEMPAPISQEFGWALKEVKMGVSLEESLQKLNLRLLSEDLRLITNAVLVAEITGGDLVKVFNQIVTTIRDNRKLRQSIVTLTLQGRIQGVVMSMLPFLFVAWVLSTNRNHFDIMLSTEMGRMLLLIAGILIMAGIILIRRFSLIRGI